MAGRQNRQQDTTNTNTPDDTDTPREATEAQANANTSDAPPAAEPVTTVEIVDEAQLPLQNRAGKDNPYTTHVQSSYDNGKDTTKRGKNVREGSVKSITVDASQADTAQNRIRQAAAALDMGVNIRREELDGGKIKIYFRAKTRNARN